jgi:hypothetical protein
VITAWQKLLLGLAVCLPIPVLALSGLAVPLPTAVYRAAAAFVESTENLAGVLAGRDAETVAPPVPRALSKVREERDPRQVTRPRIAVRTGLLLSASTRRIEPLHGRSSGGARSKRSTKSPRAVEVRRSPAPPNEGTTPMANAVVATPTPTATAPAPERKKELPATEPSPRPVEVAHVEPPVPTEPPTSPPPPPAPQPIIPKIELPLPPVPVEPPVVLPLPKAELPKLPRLGLRP